MSDKKITWHVEYCPVQITAIPPGYKKCSVYVYEDGKRELIIQNIPALALCKEWHVNSHGHRSNDEDPENPEMNIVPIIISGGSCFGLNDWMQNENDCENIELVCMLEPDEPVPALNSPIVERVVAKIEKRMAKNGQ
jgi:hypothetical protein